MIYIWAGVIALSIIIEFVTMEVVSIWFSVGALVALILEVANVSLSWQIIVFIVISLGLLLSLRKVLTKFLKKGTIKTNIDSHIGKKTKLLTEIKDAENYGTIKLNGIVWSASSAQPIEAESHVEIVAIDGNKFVVKKIKEEKK